MTPKRPSMNKKALPGLPLVLLIISMLAMPAARAQSAFSNAVVNLNPVAYWPLQETAQPPAADVEINLGSLGAAANAYYSSTNVIKGMSPIPGDSADFSVGTSITAAGSFLAVPTTGGASILPAGPFSVEVWVNPTNVATASTILAQTGAAGSGGLGGGANSAGWSLNVGYMPSLGVTMPGTISFHVYNGVGSSGGAEATFTSSSFAVGSWYHIVGVFDGTNAMLEVNRVQGSSIQPLTGKQAIDTWDPLTIGCGRGLNNNKFGGNIDEVAIYTNALSATQIGAHYDAGSGGGNYKNTILADHPYMYWRMDAPAYTTPDSTAYPTAFNYGTGVGINGLYLSGTTPGVAGPTNAGFGSTSLACAFNGIGTDSTNAIPIFTNGIAYSTNVTAETGVIITNLLDSLNQFTNSMTFMCWFKENPADNRRNVLIGHGDNGWRTSMDGAGHVTANTTGKQQPGDASSTPLTYNDGNWHFMAMVYNNSYVPTNTTGWLATNNMYVDGLLVSSVLITNGNATGSFTNISIGVAPDHALTGKSGTYDNQILAGSLAHVAYFNSALTASQIVNLYTNATAGPLPAPVITGQPITGRTNSPGTGDNGSGTGSYIFMGVQYVGATNLQWYFNSSSNYAGATQLVSDNVKYFGTTTANMTVTNLVDSDSGYYYVVLGNGFGSVTSILASFTVINEPYITSQTPAGGTLQLYQNQNFTLSVTAGGTNLTYQWFTNGIADTTAGIASSYSLANVQTAMSGNTYYCVVLNPASQATSSTVTLSVQALPGALTSSPYSSSILALNPSGYWPLHETTPAARGDVETNLGSLGNLANGYYADWVSPLTNIVHGASGALANDNDPGVLFDNAPNGANPGYLVVPRTSPAATLRAPFTLEAWVKPVNAGFGDIVSQGPWNANANGTAGPRYGVRMCWGSGGFSANALSDFQIYVGPGAVANPGYPSTVPQTLPIGQWYHIALETPDGTNWIFYVNGAQHYSFSLPMAVDSGDPIVVGQGLWQNNGPQRGFLGSVDEVAIYTNVLDPGEIQRHYNIGAGLDTSATYKQAVMETNPAVYLRMDAPAYTAPVISTLPVATNYGIVGGNGIYSPGSIPGIVPGPNSTGIPANKSVMPGNGMSSFVDVGNNTAFNPTGATAFSYGAWFQGNPMDARSFQTIMGRSDNSFRTAINAAGKVQAHAGATDITSSAIYNDGLWHQFIITYTGTNTTYNSTNTGALGVNTLYVDGVQVGQSVGGANPGTNLDVMIGDDPGNTNNPVGTGRSVAGQVCEAAFWNGVALSSNQVVGLYNSSGISPTISKQPVSASVNANGVFTNSVTALGSNPLSYQWYRDNLPLPTGGQTNLTIGATNASLIISPVKGADNSANYYVVVSNSSGSVTSSVVSLTVFTQPVFTNEPVLITQTNNILLFAGAMPTFKVGTLGALPTYYQWFTNNVAATAQGTNLTSYVLPVEPGLASFYCVASNFVGSTTDTPIFVTVLADPTAPYPQAVLASGPIGYWRLNEPDDTLGDYNAGQLCHDYLGGNNGIYTNTDLGQPGYNPTTDPSTTSARFGFDSLVDDDAYGITGIDFGAPTGSVTFSVEAWVNGYSQTKDAGIVSKGYGNGGEQFDLDTGSHVTINGQTTYNFRFLVRDASGATHTVNSTIAPNPGAQVWYHLVGVCDEMNSNVTLYVDGAVAGTAAITPGSGLLPSTRAMIIGSRPSSSTTNANDYNFVGYVNDVAVYNYALSAAQVGSHYASAGVPPNLTQAPSTNINVNGYGTLSLPAGAVGTAPLSYTWHDTLYGTNISIGSTNGTMLDASLTVTNVPLAWNGDTLELTVQNSYGSTNLFVTLTVFTNAPQITADLPPQVAVVTGKPYLYSIGVVGPQPYSYQWYNGATLLGGQTNSTYSVVAGSPGSTTYSVVVTNIFGAVTSSVSTFTSIAPLSGYAYATNVLALNPAGYWPLQETNAQAPATIETNYGLLGRLGNAYYAITNNSTVVFNQSGAISGDTDPAVLFTATNINSYAFVPRATPALTMRPPFSFECWEFSSSTGFGDLMGEGGGTGLNAANGAGNFGGARLSYGGNNAGGANLQFYIANGNGTTRNDVATPANSLPTGLWHHCVATYDGTTTIIYIDGVQQANSSALSGANTLNPDTWSPFTIGGAFWENNGPNRETAATVDEVAVYTNILSQTQVTSHYQAGTGAGNYSQTILGDHPLLYYRMNSPGYTNTPEPFCPEAINYGSALVNGSYLSGVAPGTASGPTNSVLGTGAVAAPINGVISCVDAGNDPSFNPSGTQSFTAVTWFQAYPSDDRAETIMSHGVTNWAMNLDGTTGRLVWNLFFTGGQVTSTNILNDGNWHFVAGVYDGTTSNSYLYVDGQLNSSLNVSNVVASEPGANLYLGGNSDYTLVGNNQRYFGGALAQAAFFTNALTSAQIQTLYSSATVIPTISISGLGANAVITYTGTLLSSTNISGPYNPVPGASSPYPVSPTGPQMFYRTSP
jgi:hypothetical protein